MKKIVVISGGTGGYTLLKGLKKYDNIDITAIVNMVDDGGSTGVLRDELGALPPGDIRQCLVALSESDVLMRELMNYRFPNGGLGGHSFGNLFITALEKVSGNFEHAIEKVGKVLAIKGKVIPITVNETRLRVELYDGSVINGEKNIKDQNLCEENVKRIHLLPQAIANPKAMKAIQEADLVIIGPGSLYSSLIPNLLVKGIPESLCSTNARLAFVTNLVNKSNETPKYMAHDHAKLMECYVGRGFDHILFNTEEPSDELVDSYSAEGDLVGYDERTTEDSRFIPIMAFGKDLKKSQEGDMIKRNLIRHDSDRLSRYIIGLL